MIRMYRIMREKSSICSISKANACVSNRSNR